MMFKVEFNKIGKEIEVEANTTLLECIRNAGLKLETPCNAMGVCGKCKVLAWGELSEVTKEEKKFINEEKNERLACLTKVIGNATIELINEKKKLKTINSGTSKEVEVNSVVKEVKMNPIEKDFGNPYVDSVKYTVNDCEIYEKIGLLEFKASRDIYGVIYNDEIIDISDKEKDIFGVALDIGTTGISSYLVDLKTGEVLNKVSSLNPQTEFGGDVLTRITYCMDNEKGSLELKTVILKEINNLIYKLVDKNFKLDEVYHIAIAANTTMLHLLLGVNTTIMARSPYRPVFLNSMDIRAKDLNIDVNKGAYITLIPSASSYVGADIISGIVACDFQNKKHSSIFVDIGTNGEMVAIHKGKLAATSTAAGPALEGMNIACGCRAQEGAIESLEIDENFNISYSTIGNTEALGICGSGLIDIAAALVHRKIVLKSGRFNKDLPPKLKHRLKDKKFYITDNVYISQKDIRQIQLAKGAIAAGIIMLLKSIGVNIDEIEETVIAGAFGYHVNPNSIKTIGLIPKGFNGKVTFAGNTSVEGARLALINKECFLEMKKIRKNINVLELSTDDKFQEHFMKELNF
ncbi:ASKHA domain-containing protein [Haloimpatiens sp. FM7315]|uniref:ASKHA domain-containing protein n=1 Tax=Haloimpatiens sp. FM7315 TaxID=3298609 RepID=UPI00370CF674